MSDFIQSVIIGVITGAFSGGAVWGVLKTELRWLRRDIDRVLKHLGWE
jgi:hypothetical protein